VMPLASELFFHGGLFTPLRRGRAIGAVVFATAAYDALLYLEPRVIAPFLLAFVAFGWIRALTASVYPSLAARVAFFAVIQAPVALGRDGPPITKTIAAGGSLLAVLALAALAALARRDPRIVDARLDDA